VFSAVDIAEADAGGVTKVMSVNALIDICGNKNCWMCLAQTLS
jgi:hypothetical protein